MQRRFEYNWSRPHDAHVHGPIRRDQPATTTAEMDATIIEVAFHDNVAGRGASCAIPKGRDQIARSRVPGDARVLRQLGQSAARPTQLADAADQCARREQRQRRRSRSIGRPGQLTPASVQRRRRDRLFAFTRRAMATASTAARVVSGGGTTTATITGFDPTLPYYFKVVAVNAGGESKASEVVTALPSGGAKQVLIVNGFDRFDRDPGFPLHRRLHSATAFGRPRLAALQQQLRLRRAGAHGHSGREAGHSRRQHQQRGRHQRRGESHRLRHGDLDSRHRIDRRMTRSTPRSKRRSRSFINAGGNLFLSGSEIGWDLDPAEQRPHRSTRTRSRATTWRTMRERTPRPADAGGIFAGMSSFAFSNGSAFSSSTRRCTTSRTPT